MNERDNLTSAELEAYHSALKEAYPAPKSDIHGNVMKQIRAERQRMIKMKRRAAFVKWGSVAACLLLVCVIAFRIAPGTDKLAPAAENNAESFTLNGGSSRGYDNDAVAYAQYGAPADNAVADVAVENENNGDPVEYLYENSGKVENDAVTEPAADEDLEMPSAEAPATEAPATEKPTILAPETEEETEETEEEPETESPELDAAE